MIFYLTAWTWIALIPVHLALATYYQAHPAYLIAHFVAGLPLCLAVLADEARRLRRPSPEEWAALIEGEGETTVREWMDAIRDAAGKRR